MVESVEPLTDGQDIVFAGQYAGDLPIYGGELSIVFKDEDIIGISGTVFSDAPHFSNDPRFTLTLENIASDVGAEAFRKLGSFEYTFESATDSFSASLVADQESWRPVWMIANSEKRNYYDADSGSFVREESMERNTNKPATMRHRNPDPDDLDALLSSSYEQAYCERTGGPYSCVWHLNYDSASLEINVFDLNSSLDTASSTCQTPAFFSSGSNYNTSSYFRQSDTYWWAKKARDYYTVNGSVISRSNSDGASFFIDANSNICVNGVACYISATNAIYVEGTQSVRTIIHEYGHHMSTWYGEFGFGCSETGVVDDADSLSELFADSVSMIVMLDDVNDSGMLYGIDWRALATGCNPCTDRRHTYGNIHSYGDFGCSEVHYRGAFFRAALWEVLFNRDCDEDSVCTPSTTFGSDIGWATAVQARQKIFRASLYATKILGSGIATYDDYAFWMYVYLGAYQSTLVANNFRKVVEHHGLDL